MTYMKERVIIYYYAPLRSHQLTCPPQGRVGMCAGRYDCTRRCAQSDSEALLVHDPRFHFCFGSFQSHIALDFFVKETCLTRMVTNFQSRRQPGTWLLILLTSCFTCKWVDMLVSWMVGAPTIAGTSWARLLERARLNPISAFPLCCSNGTKALVLP